MVLLGHVGHVAWRAVSRTALSLFVQLSQQFFEVPQIFFLLLFILILKHNIHTEKHIYLVAYQGQGSGRDSFGVQTIGGLVSVDHLKTIIKLINLLFTTTMHSHF